MDETFENCFSQLQLNSDLSLYTKDAVVRKIAGNKAKTLVRIYVTFSIVTPKTVIHRLEEAIKKTYFAKSGEKIHIIEDFNLSVQYTPQNFYEMYRDSLFQEVEDFDALVFRTLHAARFEFPDTSEVDVILPDNIVFHSQELNLLNVLDRVFCGRAHFDIKIVFSYEAVSADVEERNEAKIQAKVHEISQLAERARLQKEIRESGGEEKKVPASVEEFNGKTMGRKGKYTEYGNSIKHSDRADVLFGKEFDDECMRIDEIIDEIGQVSVRGQVVSIEFRPIKNEKCIVSMVITDFTDSISVKAFIRQTQQDEFSSAIKEGSFIKVKGEAAMDSFAHEVTISHLVGILSIPDFTTQRMDLAPRKRVELHCHTKMSDMDGVSEVKDIIKTAQKWGHKALAVTDHGVVQSFVDAYHAVGKSDFKVLYGCEIYLVDDGHPVITDSFNQVIDEESYVVFDIETTGTIAKRDKIIEIGAVRIEHGEKVGHFSEFINPEIPISAFTTKLTSITDADVIPAPKIDVILPRFLEFCKGAVMVGHNSDFDMGFIKAKCEDLGLEAPTTYMDTVISARYLHPKLTNYQLQTVAKACGVNLEQHHRAVYDAECTGDIFLEHIRLLKEEGAVTFDDMNRICKPSVDSIRRMHPYHCIVIAKNDLGRINLYRLVSESHLKYYSANMPKVPKIPRSLLEECREGLIIGSACAAGELFQAVIEEKPESELTQIASFYDYLEVQPIGNNSFMLEKEKYAAQTEEDLRDYVRKIVALGEKLHKPVVATCDVHFLNPEDEIYRRVILAGKKMNDDDDECPLYLHTTDEMLEEFSYLGREKAEEIVIDNTNLIADMCDYIAPVRPDKCPPVIEDSDKTLRTICYNKAHAMYGPDLPEIVTARLERELNSIIGNGYAVMYIIAQKLVWKSNEDGYLVGSRGSVGSSFVATMAGITEVNPLSPHYLCPNCFYVDFDSDEVKAYAGRSGCDMPDKVCPKCGAQLKKEGFDIPFETFLGFKGNKEPDIDLNFSGDYQSKAHKYTEVIFGAGQTFKAGTIGTLADKTAFGFIKHYYEEKGVEKRGCEINRIVKGCVGVRRTTGQHPGGIIVLPVGENIYSFTPIQHPANDFDSDIITTHFDYHSIDSNLLKLDILGHDDPTMIRMLEDLIGIDAKAIPLDDKGVMSLFMNTSALGVTPKDLWNECPLGTLGIPEFGTDFAMGMLIDAKPTEFSDLVRIAGLAHGTDVWLGNAADLIASGTATISTCICTRDDIMTYLIGMGLESERSFKIMEAVRKGRVASHKCDTWDEWKQDMIDHGVPDWYIGSCEKIMYMFPKAHAVAYVMMAWRVAYCKINYPLEFYASFFSIRAKAFDYALMCMGKKQLEGYLEEFKQKIDDKTATPNEEAKYKDMRLVQEMYARGYEFWPIDLYKSDARYFQVVDGKLLPPFTAIAGLGESAAETLQLAAEDQPFSSKEDLRNRGKVSKTIVDTMEELGIIRGLPESDQLSIFDFNFQGNET